MNSDMCARFDFSDFFFFFFAEGFVVSDVFVEKCYFARTDYKFLILCFLFKFPELSSVFVGSKQGANKRRKRK
jgi:hypothetical protein